MRAVYETGTPTVVVLVNGRPLSTRWTAEHVPAILEAWRPGERGGEAVADVLFGDYNPTGRLAITIPRHVGQLPAYYNYKPGKDYWIKTERRGYVDMPATPLYPFGHGLSYTNYEYKDLQIEPREMHPGGSARVSLDVTNTGDREGTETVQVYTHEVESAVATPVKQLRGFRRVELKPGETKRVKLTLSPRGVCSSWTGICSGAWSLVSFEIMVGRSSEDLPLTGALSVVP